MNTFDGKTYDELVAEGMDPEYACELTGNVEKLRELWADLVPVLYDPVTQTTTALNPVEPTDGPDS